MVQVPLAGVWIGNTFGTHPGPMHAEITEDGEEVTVSLRVNTQGQLTQFRGTTSRKEPLAIALREQGEEAHATAEAGQPTTVELICKSISENLMEGTWQSTVGGAGVFRLERYRFAQSPSEPTPQADRPKPTALQVRELPVDPVYMDLPGIKRLIAKILDMTPGNPGSIVTYRIGKDRVSHHSDQFLAATDLPLRVDELTVVAAKQDGAWNKVVTVTLGQDNNLLRVEWGDTQWVSGTADVLSSFLKEYGSRPLGIYRKFYRELHTIALLAFIVFLPNSVSSRGVLLVGLMVILIAHNYLVSRITRSRLYLGTPPAYAVLYETGRTALAVLTTIVGGTCVALLGAYLRSRWSLP